jgi:glycine cleavage system aminomethyltransferase T
MRAEEDSGRGEIKMDFTFTGIPHSPFLPPDPGPGTYDALFGNLYPKVFTTWQDEVMSWKQSAYIHAGLNPTFTYRISGPDALQLLKDHCVNSFAKFSIGASKHAIMCNDAGLIMAHGIVLRESEDSFITFWLMPWINYLADCAGYEVKGENLTGQKFLIQVAGPKALDVLEDACDGDLRGIKFLFSKPVKMAGADVSVGARDVDVLRVGMAGSLAYEVHGPVEAAQEVYRALWEAGQKHGLVQLGREQYRMNHTENGFPQGHVHFMFPWFSHPGLAEYMSKIPGASGFKTALRGSAGQDPTLRYRNPVELGWARTIKFDHDFLGRAALEAEVKNPTRQMVTLTWNPDDILDIYRSHFQPGTEFPMMKFQMEDLNHASPAGNHLDLVTLGGKTVGLSSGRTYSYYYRKMISLCSLDSAHCAPGTELSIIWGDPGSRQKEIRAVVDRYPLFDEGRNEAIDVSFGG